MDIQTDHTGAITHRTAQLSCIIRKISGFAAKLFGLWGLCKNFAQIIMDIGIGGYSRTHVNADGRGVDQLNMPDIAGIHLADMVRHRRLVNGGVKGRHKTFQDQCCFAGAGNPGHCGQPTFGKAYVKGPDRMDGIGG